MDYRKFFGMETRASSAMSGNTLEDYVNSITGRDGLGLQYLTTQKKNALNLSAVYACVNLISDTVSTLPLLVKKRNGKGVSNVLKNHVIAQLFNDKGNLITTNQLLKLVVQSIILRGNAFIYIQRASDGTPIRLQYLEASDVTIQYDKARPQNLYYSTSLVKGSKVIPNDMLHFVKNTFDGVQGVSVLKYASRSFDLANAAEEQANKFYSQGCSINGLISTPAVLSEKQRMQILDSWNKSYSNSAGLAVVGGQMTFTPLSLNAEDSQLLSTREFSAKDIARFFQVPPSLIGASDKAHSDFESEQQEFMLRTILPYIICIESEMNRKLVTENNVKVILDMESSLRASKTVLASYYTSLHQNGLMSTNECRQYLGLPSVEGGDALTIAYTDISQNTIGNQENSSNDEEKQ